MTAAAGREPVTGARPGPACGASSAGAEPLPAGQAAAEQPRARGQAPPVPAFPGCARGDRAERAAPGQPRAPPRRHVTGFQRVSSNGAAAPPTRPRSGAAARRGLGRRWWMQGGAPRRSPHCVPPGEPAAERSRAWPAWKPSLINSPPGQRFG
ncbi:forkhead box protein L2 [Strigops habroptila]|uniref:forkhead box protein L2 n=1 Tax=Strigops habroptila TaxID=2489341 RepID=UPI0011CEE76B|nr:forkhead box protein L2 [Strigops habroptila]